MTWATPAAVRFLSLSLVAAIAAVTVTASVSPDCENFGLGFSEASGPNAYTSVFPPVDNIGSFGRQARGYDDSVAFLVGGDFLSQTGAEVEGKMVVLGDLTIEQNGCNSLVVAGLGSLIHPTSGGTGITVGGDITIKRSVAIMQETATMNTDIAYGGSCEISYWAGTFVCPTDKAGLAQRQVYTNGKLNRAPGMDLSVYNEQLASLEKKSTYWGSLPVNGQWIDQWGEIILSAGNSNTLQVFSFPNGIPDGKWGITFDQSMNGKTILINMGGANVFMKAAVMCSTTTNGRGQKKCGTGSNNFDILLTQNILWNFYEANDVLIRGSDEVQGSILIPKGNLRFETVGQSGRTLVGGNVIQNRWGSEFHNYEFDPLIGALPLPNDSVCPNTLVGPGTSNSK